jgi:hypothetical protein
MTTKHSAKVKHIKHITMKAVTVQVICNAC